MVIGVTFRSLQTPPKSRDLEFIPLPLIFKTNDVIIISFQLKMFDRGITRVGWNYWHIKKSGILPQIHIQQIKRGISI